MKKILEARYLNVDFLVESTYNLSYVADYLKKYTRLLWYESNDGVDSLGIESNLIDTETPEEDIHEIISVIESAPKEVYSVLLTECKKTFDIGFECGEMCAPIEHFLSVEVLQKIVSLHSNMNIRLYPYVELPSDL